MSPTQCSSHGSERAAWICQNCHRKLCPSCAARRGETAKAVLVCVHCRGLAEDLVVSRRITPYWMMLGTFVRSIFTLQGFLQISLVSLASFLLMFVPIIGPLLAIFPLAGYCFRVIQNSALGGVTLPENEELTPMGVVGPGVRLILALIITYVPLMLYLHYGIGWSKLLTDPMILFRDPIPLILTVGSILYLPAAIIAAAVSESVITMINPLVTVRMIVRIPGQYVLTLIGLEGFLWLFSIVMAPVQLFLVASLGFFAAIPFIIGLTLAAYTFASMILGRLIFQNGEHFGLNDGVETVLEFPGAVPSGGTVEEQPRVYRSSLPAIVPIAISEPAPPAANLLPQTNDLILQAPAVREVSDAEGQQPDMLTEALRICVTQGDRSGALVAYDALSAQGHFPELAARDAVKLAHILEDAGRFSEAVLALRRTVKADPEGIFAPSAVFQAARILSEKLQDPDRARMLFNYLVTQFPEHELASRSTEALQRLVGATG